MRIALVQADAVAAITELMRASGPFNKVGRPQTAAFSRKLFCQRIFLLEKRAECGCLSQALLRPSLHCATGAS